MSTATKYVKPESASARSVSRVRKRVVLNVPLLIGTVVFVSIGATALYFWYQRQHAFLTTEMLRRAEVEAEQGNWAKSAGYLRQYLAVEPGDVDALELFADRLGKDAKSGEQIARINTVLYRILGQRPENHAVRLQLAENLLAIGDFSNAKSEAEALRQAASKGKPESDLATDSQRIAAISQVALAGQNDASQLRAAWKETEKALAASPGDVQLVQVASSLLRTNWEKLGLSSEQAAKLANQAMDRLIESRPADAEALLARYMYKTQYGIADARSDLDAALASQPNHYQATLLKAAALLQGNPSTKQLAESEVLARRAIELQSENPAAYLALAKLLERKGEFRKASDALIDGVNAAEGDKFALSLALPTMLVRAGALDEAETALTELRKQSSQYLARLPQGARRQVDRQVNLCEAQVVLARGGNQEVIPQLVRIKQELSTRGGGMPSNDEFQATRLLASALAAAERWDEAGVAYQELGELIRNATSGQPASAEAAKLESEVRLAAAQLMLRTAQFESAIANLNRHVELTGITATAAADLVKAHLQRQLKRPNADRHWDEFRRELDRAKDQFAKASTTAPLSLVLAEVEYLLSQSEGSQSSEDGSAEANVRKALDDAEAEYGDNSDYWKGAAIAYQRLGNADDLKRAIENFQKVEPSLTKRAFFKAAVLTQGNKREEADASLVEAISHAPEDEKLGLELFRLRFLLSTGRLDVAKDLADSLVAREPKNLQCQLLAAEAFLLSSEWQKVTELERQIEENVGAAHFDLGFLRARRMAAAFNALKPDQRRELGVLIAKLRAQRPSQSSVVALAARVASLEGDTKKSLADYRTAVAMGDSSAEVLQGYIDLLVKTGDFEEAQRQLATLEAARPNDNQLESFAIGLALQRNRIPEALDRAREAVKANPNDPARRVWLANILARDGQTEAASDEFEQIAQDFPQDSRALSSWFSYLLDAGNEEKAREVLARLANSADLPAAQRDFVLGQCYERLGERDAAIKSYRLAVNAAPNDVNYRLRLARMLFASDLDGARKELDQVLKLDPNNVEARRQLATLLAASGAEDDWSRVTELLRASGGGSQAEDERLRALLLVQKGQSRKDRIANTQQAAGIVKSLVSRSDNANADLDRLLFAGICEQEAVLANRPQAFVEARRVILPVVERPQVTSEIVRLYTRFLLRALNSKVVADLPKAEQQKISRLFLSDAVSRVNQLKLFEQKSLADLLENLSIEVAVLAAEGKPEEAKAALTAFEAENAPSFKTDNERAQLYLQIGGLFVELGEFESAREIVQRLISIAPRAYSVLAEVYLKEGKLDEALQVYLDAADADPSANVATGIAQILASTRYSGSRLAAANALLEDRLEQHSENPMLLLAMGVLSVERGEADLAIDFFRRVTKSDPQNALALNNLATLLGERAKDRHEAIECIDRAIAVQGRKAPLLDTRGTIYLLAGDYAKAIESLEEAVAGGNIDPRYDFHLAVAYQRADRLNDARRSMEIAEEKGLASALLTDNDEKLLAELQEALKQASASE